MKDEQHDELGELTAGYLDGTLNDEQRARFEQLLRENPAALSRVGDAVRFDVELRDAMNPDHIELIEQRRMVIDRVTGKPVLVEKSQRVAQRGEWLLSQEASGKRSKRGWLALLLLIPLAGGAVWLLARKQEAPVASAPVLTWQTLPLKNEGFEKKMMTPGGAVDLTTLPNWEDKFSTRNALLMNKDAHSGSQSAQLKPGGHIKQLLERSEGVPLNFEPGLRVKVSGWIKLLSPPDEKHHILRVDLHFVDEKLDQYAVNYDLIALAGAAWQPFQVEFTVPDQAKFKPSWADPFKGEALSVHGRQILLSLYNDSVSKSFATDVLMDDIKIEWASPATAK